MSQSEGQPMMPQYTVKEYAEIEGVKESVVLKWIERGLVGVTDVGMVLRPEPEYTTADRRGYAWQWFSGVYFVLCDGFVKIGYAHDVRLRLKNLCWWNPHPVEPLGFIQCDNAEEARSVEGSLHVHFKRWNEHHEWFKDSLELRDFIKYSASPWPAPKRVQ